MQYRIDDESKARSFRGGLERIDSGEPKERKGPRKIVPRRKSKYRREKRKRRKDTDAGMLIFGRQPDGQKRKS
jgi:hypothetical protein